MVVPIPGSEQVRNLRIDAALVGLFELLRHSRSLRELKRIAGGEAGEALFAELIDLTVLVPAELRPLRRARPRR